MPAVRRDHRVRAPPSPGEGANPLPATCPRSNRHGGDRAIRLEAPSPFMRDRVRDWYASDIRTLWSELVGERVRAVQVEMVVAERPAVERPKEKIPSHDCHKGTLIRSCQRWHPRRGRFDTVARRGSWGPRGCGHSPAGHRASSKPRGRRRAVFPPRSRERLDRPYGARSGSEGDAPAPGFTPEPSRDRGRTGGHPGAVSEPAGGGPATSSAPSPTRVHWVVVILSLPSLEGLHTQVDGWRFRRA